MKMQIIFLFVANPASQMPKSVWLSKLSYEHPAKPRDLIIRLAFISG